MARHLRKHNRQFYTYGATKVPSVTQDRYYSADWVRDMRYNEGLAARALLDLLGVSSVLVSGGLVTQGSSVTQLNITAAVGLCDFDVEVPADDTAWAVPPAFETRQIAVTARSPALTNFDLTGTSMNFDGATANYLKLQYLEGNVKTRARKYGATTYAYSVEDSYALVCDVVAATAKDVLLATLVGNGTSTLTITQNTNTAKVLKALNADTAATATLAVSSASSDIATTAITAINAMNFDLVIDSNAKLAQWAASGTYAKVLIKAGTWTLASGGIDLTARGTKYIFGEAGSVLVFSESTTGLSYTTAPSTNDYRIEGVSVECISTSTANAFLSCVNLFNCKGSTSGAGANSYAFQYCENIINCSGSASGPGNVRAFASCGHLTNCVGTGSGTGTGTSHGFYSCAFLSNCTGAGNNTGTGTGHGFGFCGKMQHNYATGKTAKYVSSYADSGSSYACADTPNGGFNS